MRLYAKAVAAFVGALATWGTAAFADGQLETVELFGLGPVVLAVFAVYGVTNA